MARSILEIYDEMVTEKQQQAALNVYQPNIDNSQNLLNDLTSASKVAVWRTALFIVAVAIYTHEVIFDRHKEEIETRAQEIITGPTQWYADQCFLFQYGDTLTWNGKKYVYDPINEQNRIIKRAAVIEAAGQVRIKVAKIQNNLPAPLSASELTSFKSYIALIKFAGSNIAIISRDADLLKISFDVYYDPLVLNSSGELISNTSIKPVEVAINSYIQELPFNGILNLTKLVDSVQAAEGVIDPILINAEAKYGQIPYAPINREYNADAGHMKIDPAYPLHTQINYIPVNV